MNSRTARIMKNAAANFLSQIKKSHVRQLFHEDTSDSEPEQFTEQEFSDTKLDLQGTDQYDINNIEIDLELSDIKKIVGNSDSVVETWDEATPILAETNGTYGYDINDMESDLELSEIQKIDGNSGSIVETWDEVTPILADHESTYEYDINAMESDIELSEVEKIDGNSSSIDEALQEVTETSIVAVVIWVTLYIAMRTRAQRTTKKHHCLYCGGLYTKLPRHLEIKHNNEVLDILNLKKGSLTRKRAWLTLQKQGDYNHLHTQIINNEDHVNIIPLRRLQHRSHPTLDDYAICPKCKGLFTKKNLKNHVREICDPLKRVTKRVILPTSRALLIKCHKNSSELVRKHIFSQMRDDSIVRLISQDSLIVEYANNITLKFRSSLHHFKMIRSEIRHLGDILNKIKSINNEITDLVSMFHPKHFDTFVKAVQMDAGFNVNTGKYRVPTRASSACTLIKKVGETAVMLSIKNERPDEQAKQENFLRLLKNLQNALINRTAIENITQNRRQKKVNLPKTDVVNDFFNYINEKILKHFSQLTKTFTKEIWITLSKLILVHILLFNRRRPGEIERAYISDYCNLGQIDDEFKVTLSEKDKSYANNFCRFVIRGKLNKPVPVILHITIKKSIDLLLHYRSQIGITSNNSYLFAKPSEGPLPQHFQSDVALKQFLAEGNFPLDSNITATNLRKHLATVVAGLQIDDDHLTDVVDFMGHHVNIHKRIYRQMPVARDVINMGSILMTAAGASNTMLNLSDTTPEKPDLNNLEPAGKRSEQNPQSGMVDLDVEETSTFFTDEPMSSLLNPEYTLPDATSITEDVNNSEPSGENPKQSHWSDQENKACEKYFSDFFVSGHYPSSGYIRQVCSSVPCLAHRTPRRLKSHLQHLKKCPTSNRTHRRRL